MIAASQKEYEKQYEAFVKMILWQKLSFFDWCIYKFYEACANHFTKRVNHFMTAHGPIEEGPSGVSRQGSKHGLEVYGEKFFIEDHKVWKEGKDGVWMPAKPM